MIIMKEQRVPCCRPAPTGLHDTYRKSCRACLTGMDALRGGQAGCQGDPSRMKLLPCARRTARKVIEGKATIQKESIASTLLANQALNLWGIGSALIGLQVRRTSRGAHDNLARLSQLRIAVQGPHTGHPCQLPLSAATGGAACCVSDTTCLPSWPSSAQARAVV